MKESRGTTNRTICEGEKQTKARNAKSERYGQETKGQAADRNRFT